VSKQGSDHVGTGTWPLFIGWTLFMVTLLIFYMVIGILGE
jgi:hypothetical protein